MRLSPPVNRVLNSWPAPGIVLGISHLLRRAHPQAQKLSTQEVPLRGGKKYGVKQGWKSLAYLPHPPPLTTSTSWCAVFFWQVKGRGWAEETHKERGRAAHACCKVRCRSRVEDNSMWIPGHLLSKAAWQIISRGPERKELRCHKSRCIPTSLVHTHEHLICITWLLTT